MYSITFYHPASRALRAATTPSPEVAFLLATGLRRMGYAARIWRGAYLVS